MEASAQEVLTTTTTNDTAKSARGKRSFSDLEDGQEKQLATDETGSGPVVVEDSESHSNIKRAKVDTASDAPEPLAYKVPWSEYRYDVELVLPSYCASLVIVRCHATQLALFPYFQASLKDEWRAAETGRVYRLDMTSLKWFVHHWIPILECCYRRAPLKPREDSETIRPLLFKWSELKRHFRPYYVELDLCLELLYFLNATTKAQLLQPSLLKTNTEYLTSFVCCFFLTSDPANPDDLALFRKIVTASDDVSPSIAVRAVELVNQTEGSPLSNGSPLSKVMKWAFLSVALHENRRNDWDTIYRHMSSFRNTVTKYDLRDTDTNYKRMDDFLYWTAVFMYEELFDGTRKPIAGNRDTCMRTFFQTHENQRFYDRQFNISGFFSAKFSLTYDKNNNSTRALFDVQEDDDSDDMDGNLSSDNVISLRKHFHIFARHPDAGAVRAMNYAGVLTSVMLQWRSQ